MKKYLLSVLFVLYAFLGFSQNFKVIGLDTITQTPGFLYTLKPTYTASPLRSINDSTIGMDTSRYYISTFVPNGSNDSLVLTFAGGARLPAKMNVGGGQADSAYFWQLIGNTHYDRSKFIGSKDSSQFRIRTKNLDRLAIDSVGSIGIGIAPNTTYLVYINGVTRFNQTIHLPNDASTISNGAGSDAVTSFIPNTGSGWKGFIFGSAAAGSNEWFNITSTSIGANKPFLVTGIPNTDIFNSDYVIPANVLFGINSNSKGFLPPRLTTTQITAITGTILTISASGGSGYVTGTSLSFSGGGGSNAAGYIDVTSGAITAAHITNYGSGFTSAPTVTAPTGTGATITATVGIPPGLIVFNTDSASLFQYNGTAWQNLYSTAGTGTITSIATTSPITGGTITTTGTIACATCVVSSSPGAGIAHFAGSTQSVTSSAVSLTADVTGVLAETNGGTNQSTYATGDILYASGTNTLSKLPIGTTRQKLGVVGGVPAWVDSTAAGGGGGTVTSVSGTTNRVTSSGGTTPVIDISSTYDALFVKVDGTVPLTGNWNMGAFTATYTKTGATAATVYDGFVAYDTTSASAANQMYGGAFHSIGKGWETTTPSSKKVDFRWYTKPVQATTNPNATWNLDFAVNGGAFSNVLNIDQAGNLVAAGSVTATASMATVGLTSANGSISSTKPGIAATTTIGLQTTNGTAATSPVPIQRSPSIRQTGTGWTGAASQVADYAFEVRPVNGTSPITANWVLMGQVNAGGYADLLSIANAGNVTVNNGNLTLGTAGNALLITEGSNGRVGQTTLVAGTKAITITGLTTSSRALVQLVTPSGVALTITYQAVCTANTLTIQANVAAGTINVNDISVLNYFVIN